MEPVSEVSGAKVGIIGLGASGYAAARLALARGGQVYVSDLRRDAAVTARGDELRAAGARVELGGHDVGRLVGADLVVVSPGIPPDAPVLRALADRGVRWISEPEFAVRFYAGPLIAVTGTNGKTTSSVLMTHLLKTAGRSVELGGNVGGGLAPAASELALRPEAPEWYILEMSSFQLAGIDRFRPDIGVVTNLSPDHLDRYRSVEDYYADKARIFTNADAGTRWVLGDQAEVEELAGDAPGDRYRVGPEPAPRRHAFVRDDVLTLRVSDEEERLVRTDELQLLGAHNHVNALTASLVASLAGVNAAAIAEGLRSARPLRHRLEPVAETDGVLWVNDSKATNVAATVSALASLDRPVVLLVGGRDKGEDLAALRAAVKDTARCVITFGAAGPRMAEGLAGAARVVEVAGGLEAVVTRAAREARAGDIVLLSPACSSFDMFSNYEERGRRFSELAVGIV